MKARVSHWYLAAGLILTVLYYGRTPLTAEVIQVVGTLVTAVAVVVGMRLNRSKNRLAWSIFTLSLFFFAGEHVCGAVNVINGKVAAGLIGDTLDLLGYGALLIGAVIALRERTRRDAGGVLDSVVFAVAGGTVIWEFVMLDKLTSWHTSVPELTLSLTQMLIIIAGVGILVRFSRTAPESGGALGYMFATLAGGLFQIVVFPIVSTSPGRLPGSAVEAIGLLAMICVGATALHPSMAQITEPGPQFADRLSTRRLLMLGLAMVTAPISVGVWQLMGHDADSVLLVISAIAIVPLVLYRIHGCVVERARAEAALAHRALHDSLTALPNRAQFVGLLQATLQRVREGNSAQVAVLFCDLDGFKAVNDLLGHTAGDRLLTGVAKRLQECVRVGDVVSRFGGDEFLILCEHATDAPIATHIAARITAGLDRPISVGNARVTIGASIGIAVTTADGDLSPEEIIRDADLAMYAAKQADRSPEIYGSPPAPLTQAPVARREVPDQRERATRPSSQTGSAASYTVPSAPKIR